MVRLKPRHNVPPWFNSGLQHHLHCIKSLWKKLSHNNTTYRITKLEEAERRLSEFMSDAKTFYESQLVDAYTFNNSNKRIIKTHSLPAIMPLSNKSATSTLITLISQIWIPIHTSGDKS